MLPELINITFLWKFQTTRTFLNGIFPPLTTPFQKDESIAWNELKSNVQHFNQIESIKGYLAFGSNGEYVYLTEKEKLQIIEQIRQIRGKDKLLLAGSGMESTNETVRMTQAMAAAGVDAAFVITPHYFKGQMSNDALYEHFFTVADKSPVPVILYSIPANTGIDLPVDVVLKLASHPNIAGIKDSGGDVSKIAMMVHGSKGLDFEVLAGSAGYLLAALEVSTFLTANYAQRFAIVIPNEIKILANDIYYRANEKF